MNDVRAIVYEQKHKSTLEEAIYNRSIHSTVTVTHSGYFRIYVTLPCSIRNHPFGCCAVGHCMDSFHHSRLNKATRIFQVMRLNAEIRDPMKCASRLVPGISGRVTECGAVPRPDSGIRGRDDVGMPNWVMRGIHTTYIMFYILTIQFRLLSFQRNKSPIKQKQNRVKQNKAKISSISTQD